MTHLSLLQTAALVAIAVGYVWMFRALWRFDRRDRVLRGLSREWRGEERE